jgi:hypothetical protein
MRYPRGVSPLDCCLKSAFAIPGLLAAALVTCLPAHADDAVEQMVAGIDAVLYVCTPVDPKSMKPGQDMLVQLAAKTKSDLSAVRKSDGYRATYNSELNRMLSMPAKDKLATCQRAF